MKPAMAVPLESMRSFYLTLASVIQSLALAHLLTSLASAGLPSLTFVLQAITTLTVIVTIWHEYAVFTMLFVWVIDFWDSLIPFVFGLAQFFLITALIRLRFDPAWWFGAMFCIGLVTVWAFENAFHKIPDYPENEQAAAQLETSKRTTRLLTFFACILFLGETAAAYFSDGEGPLVLGLVAASFIVTAAFAARGVHLYPKVMKRLLRKQASVVDQGIA